MICNNCLKPIQKNTQIYGNTECSSMHNNGIHIYCNSCYNKFQSTRSDAHPCNLCKTTLPKNSLFPLRGNPFSTFNQLSSNIVHSLCGYSPVIIQKIAERACRSQRSGLVRSYDFR